MAAGSPDPAADAREHALSVLVAERSLLGAVIARVPVGIALLSGPDLRLEVVNDAARVLGALRPGERLGERLQDALVPAAVGVTEVLRGVLETGRPASVDDLAVDAPLTGYRGRRHYRFTADRVLDRDAGADGVLVVVVETTAEVRRREELADQLAQATATQRQLEALARAAQAVAGSGLAIREVLDVITEQARLVVGARRAVTTLTADGPAPLPRPGWLSAPLIGRDGADLGLLQVADKAHGAFSDQDARILGQLAVLAAQAAENARLHGRVELLRQAGHTLSARNDAASVTAALASISVPALADWCTVHLVDPLRRPALAAAAHVDDDAEAAVHKLEALAGGGPARRLAARAMASGRVERAVIAVGAEDDGPVARALVQRLGSRAALSIPLRASERILGALTLVTSEGAADDPISVETALSLAAQAGVALDNAQLYDEQAHVARTLQAALLPRSLPEVSGIDLAVRYRAAGRSTEVGGDFYDVFATADRAGIGFVVGDVVGKGPEAATLTSAVRHTLRAAYLRGDGPVAAVELADRALRAAAADGQFCTLVYGELEQVEDGVALVRLARAGHPPALVLRAMTGAVEEVGGGGSLLGADVGPLRIAVVEVTLAAADVLLLYTDGATELRGTVGADAVGELKADLAAVAGRSSNGVVEAVERRAFAASGGRLRDDLALLAVGALSLRAVPQASAARRNPVLPVEEDGVFEDRAPTR